MHPRHGRYFCFRSRSSFAVRADCRFVMPARPCAIHCRGRGSGASTLHRPRRGCEHRSQIRPRLTLVGAPQLVSHVREAEPHPVARPLDPLPHVHHAAASVTRDRTTHGLAPLASLTARRCACRPAWYGFRWQVRVWRGVTIRRPQTMCGRGNPANPQSQTISVPVRVLIRSPRCTFRGRCTNRSIRDIPEDRNNERHAVQI